MQNSSIYETFIEILFELVEVDAKFDYPIYYVQNINNKNIANKLINENEVFIKEHNDFIKNNEITKLYIHIGNKELYEKDIETVFYNDINNDIVPIKRKSSLIHTFASSIMENILKEGLNKENLSKVKDIVDYSINLIADTKNSTKVMLSLVSYNYTTYTHSVDVCIYAIGFGKYLNLQRDDLKILGEGAILHDVGKGRIPNKILDKDGVLTDEEFAVIKKHPSLGKNILIEQGETNQALLDIVEQHHEKYYGGGYPHNLKKHEINRFSQIITIIDIFNALSTQRSYKNRLSTFDALNLMKDEMLDNLHPELFKKFVTFMSK